MNNLKEDDGINFLHTLRIKTKYFFDNKTPVHLKFKLGYFKNGDVIEVSEDFFILDEFLEGRLPVFYGELEQIEEYKKRGEFLK